MESISPVSLKTLPEKGTDWPGLDQVEPISYGQMCEGATLRLTQC